MAASSIPYSSAQAQGAAPRGQCTTWLTRNPGIWAFSRRAAKYPSPTIRSAVTMVRFEARASSASSYTGPSILALPKASASCTWITDTSGAMAFTAASVSPVKGSFTSAK